MGGEKILIIEDDVNILKTNQKMLELAGYRVFATDTLESAHSIVNDENPDLLILEVLLPNGNGLNYCKELRLKSDIKILFLSSLCTKNDVINGFHVGGDDYMSKPYDMDELLVRIRALLRRGRLIKSEERVLRLGALELSLSSRRAFLNGEDLLLKPREFYLLEVLIRNRDQILTAQEIYQLIWGSEANDIRTVWVHMSMLRKKLADNSVPDFPKLISIRQQGYLLTLDEDKYE
ncbi:DNA-binding response OmpR family regulator [Natronobacillus azotifigens]|uniref:Response regulator transcription factor n=1 Tax=Natronobacillus azotifigens TaxID=472978 RepID=A0A9J6RFH7_9BACI|nr:response regulator transcription factor [Natronobacillus azotifigens]MCZ0704514.1 response regulator transcription factor [Natronobacillus azotifigens]